MREVVGDVTCVVGSLALGALLLWLGDAMADPSPTVPWSVDAALGTLACLSLWWRRRWPLGLAVALTPVGAVSAMTTAAVVVAVFNVAVHRRTLVAVAVAAANLAAVTVYFAIQNEPRFDLWVDFVVRGGMLAAAVGWGLFARAQRQLVASLRDRAVRLEEDQHLRVDQARLTERTRIAREMHDVLGHRLSLVSLHAGVLEVRTDARPEEVSTAAGVIRANAHEAMQELRAVILPFEVAQPDRTAVVGRELEVGRLAAGSEICSHMPSFRRFRTAIVEVWGHMLKSCMGNENLRMVALRRGALGYSADSQRMA